MGGLFHPKDTLIGMFKTLCDTYPTLANYVPIGKSYKGKDIWLFRIGNPFGGAVLVDGSMHGFEDLGSEFLYLYAQWLLTSGDATAQVILNGNYTLLVPIVNMDSSERQTANKTTCTYGTDLNRNFVTGWSARTCSETYPGSSAGSEPETKAMKYVFDTYRPAFYLNTHYCGAAYLSYSSSNLALVNSVISRINQLSSANGVTPYEIRSGGAGGGMAVGDATMAGANAWLLETANESSYHTGPGSTPGNSCYMHNCQTLIDIQNYYFPKIAPILIAFSEACQTTTPPVATPVTPPTPPPATNAFLNVRIFSGISGFAKEITGTVTVTLLSNGQSVGTYNIPAILSLQPNIGYLLTCTNGGETISRPITTVANITKDLQFWFPNAFINVRAFYAVGSAASTEVKANFTLGVGWPYIVIVTYTTPITLRLQPNIAIQLICTYGTQTLIRMITPLTNQTKDAQFYFRA